MARTLISHLDKTLTFLPVEYGNYFQISILPKSSWKIHSDNSKFCNLHTIHACLITVIMAMVRNRRSEKNLWDICTLRPELEANYELRRNLRDDGNRRNWLRRDISFSLPRIAFKVQTSVVRNCMSRQVGVGSH